MPTYIGKKTSLRASIYRIKKSRNSLFFKGALTAFFFFLLAQNALASITYTPSDPNVEQLVSFKLNVALGIPPSVDWDFGDGFSMSGGIEVSHTYMTQGTFTVKASVSAAAPIVQTTTITITEKRRIEYTPQSPRVGTAINFKALNFLSATLKWDFGNNTIISGPAVQTHAYQSQGVYTVRVFDFGGDSKFPIKTTVQVAPAASIAYTPQKPRIGEEVQFFANNFFSNTLIRWNFGDGAIVDDTSPPSITHAYTQPGTYSVQAFDNGQGPATASVQIIIYPHASISYLPNDPRPGEEVTFSAHDFFSTSLIRWSFGHGAIEDDTSPPVVTHVYAQPGTYLVQAFDNGGTIVSAFTNVEVLMERTVTFTPLEPKTGEEITFHAQNFVSPSILWQFGDETPILQGGETVSHIYQKEKIYTVTAFDFRGTVQIPRSVSLIVYPAQGPRAPFSISYINLRFEDGMSYKTVPKGFMPLFAYAELQYQGTGILNVQWIVDGQPFGLVSKPLPFADKDQINSGEIPGLPTMEPGIHEVTLEIIQPQVEFSVPSIRYDVLLGEIKREPVHLLFEKILTLEGVEIPIVNNSIHLLPGEYCLLEGVVKNEGDKLISPVLLRIYLDNGLIDQQLIRALEAKTEKEFDVSFSDPSPANKKIYVSLYDISTKPPVLLAIKELIILPKETE
ncbi:PKD domain-containing protein [Acidobacteriota bacterium]